MKILFNITGTCLLLAVFSLPLEFYTFLRILVSVAAIAGIYYEINHYDKNFTVRLIVVFVFILLTFNPFIPLHLNDKMSWVVIDVIAAIFFIGYRIGLERKRSLKKR
ncbi:DUF6804 family protein [Flammeovirga agarivorans]|uniref:Uncharacterized protein n=1 Tax=Flammeovirga agarivorans TaxID=2726742 RepID=A0A7X8XV59_9BACT|nr:DUF6804 family protein [Flammeovirga agarivorans]NLR90770.1 hypothetical protein [Flammeovirga agarivorans]